MKKLFVLCVVMTLVLPTLMFPTFAESDDTVEITSILLKNVDFSAEEWYQSEETQAMFCAGALLDVVLLEKENYTNALTSALLSGRCYIAKSGLSLMAHFYSNDHLVLIRYIPLTNSLSAGIVEISALTNVDTLMNTLMSNGEFSTYNEVATDDILIMLQLISEAAN